MACVVGGAVVVAFDVGNGARLAAVWDGGEWCDVHTVDAGRYGPVVERWHMAGTPLACTPAALSELVGYRLTDPRAARDLAAAVRGIMGGETARPVDAGLVSFSVN